MLPVHIPVGTAAAEAQDRPSRDRKLKYTVNATPAVLVVINIAGCNIIYVEIVGQEQDKPFAELVSMLVIIKLKRNQSFRHYIHHDFGVIFFN